MSRALRRRYGRSTTDSIIRRADELGIKHHRTRRPSKAGPIYKHVDKVLGKLVDFVTGGR